MLIKKDKVEIEEVEGVSDYDSLLGDMYMPSEEEKEGLQKLYLWSGLLNLLGLHLFARGDEFVYEMFEDGSEGEDEGFLAYQRAYVQDLCLNILALYVVSFILKFILFGYLGLVLTVAIHIYLWVNSYKMAIEGEDFEPVYLYRHFSW